MEQFVECVEHACKHSAIDVDVSKFRDELVKTACLLKEEGAELSFIHKSVQEFYAASFVARSADAFAEKFYKSVRENTGERLDAWRQPIAFLGEIDEWRYAGYLWLPLADEVAKKLRQSPERVFSTEYRLDRESYLRLTEGMEVAIISRPQRPDEATEIPTFGLDWGSPIRVESGSYKEYSPLGSLWSAVVPHYPFVGTDSSGTLPSWISPAGHKKVARVTAAAVEWAAVNLDEKTNDKLLDRDDIVVDGIKIMIRAPRIIAS